MNDDCLFPLQEAEQLVQGFIECKLNKEDWTHEAHLIAGYYLLAHHGEGALDLMRESLLRFNESFGGINDDHNGYHETMTYFWLWLIRNKMADEQGQVHWNQHNLDELLADESLAERNCWRPYYSDELMKSVAARRGFVSPDKNPLIPDLFQQP